MRAACASPVPWLDGVVAQLLERPSKQLRPALVYAAAACGDGAGAARTAQGAAAVELLHLSSLVHDDVMDGSPTRSGQPSVHSTHGHAAALLVGDHLAAAGGRLAAGVSAATAAAWQRAYLAMCEGQARELAGLHRLGTAPDYLATIGGKTAALFAAACRIGAGVAALPEAQADALDAYGHAFGMLLQILDDLMDLLSTVELWGKPVHQDLANGVYTLPVILAADRRGPALTRLLSPDATAAQLATVTEIVRGTATAATLDAAHAQVERARNALGPIAGSPARRCLEQLPGRYLGAVLSTRVAAQHAHLVGTHAQASKARYVTA
jgi:geranylgeranyl pyrophosphate synthase